MLIVVQSHQKIHVSAHVVIEHRNVAARHVRHADVIVVLYKFAQNATHRNHIVVGMRRKTNHALVARQFAFTANFGAECIEHFTVNRTGRTVTRNQRRQLMIGVVGLRKLQNGRARLQCQPRNRANGHG